MRKFTIVLVILFFITACHQTDHIAEENPSFEMQNSSSEYITISGLPVTRVSSDITSNTTWSGVIEIDGIVHVTYGATLTIQPGTFIKGKPVLDYGPNGVLVITKSGKLNAVGTETQPIIFTSYNLLDGDENTLPRPGDFGGVILLGDAPTNKSSTTRIEGLSDSFCEYGGSNVSHNAGSMKYVRIEFAGYDFLGSNSGNEINGLTLGGVGTHTTLDHIQVSYSLDDSFEFFGGTVNATNLISFAPQDDNFDFENGYTGTISCGLALADYNSGHSYQNSSSPDSNGIELDNDVMGSGNFPMTHPVVNNLTIIGQNINRTNMYSSFYENGIHIRRNGKLTLNNAVVTGYPAGIKAEGTGSELSSSSSPGTIKVHGFTTSVSGMGTSGIPATNLLTGTTASSWAMSQPFFNEISWNINPRNCGNFNGTWTKYNFSWVE